MKKNYSALIFWVLLTAVILIAASVLLKDMDTETISYSNVVELFRNEEVKEFEIDENNNMTILKNDDTMVSYKLRSLELYYLDLNDMVLDQAERGIIQRYDLPAPIDIPIFARALPKLLNFPPRPDA